DDQFNAILDELRAIRQALEPRQRQPDLEPLLAEVGRVTNGFRFTVNSLFQRAELDSEDADLRLHDVLAKYCDLNAAKLGRLFAAIGGARIRRVGSSRDGILWQVKM